MLVYTRKCLLVIVCVNPSVSGEESPTGRQLNTFKTILMTLKNDNNNNSEYRLSYSFDVSLRTDMICSVLVDVIFKFKKTIA